MVMLAGDAVALHVGHGDRHIAADVFFACLLSCTFDCTAQQRRIPARILLFGKSLSLFNSYRQRYNFPFRK